MAWSRHVFRFALSAVFCMGAESLTLGDEIQPILYQSNSSNGEESATVYSIDDSNHYQQNDDSRFLINARVGTSYYSVPGESLFGAGYGLDFAYQLTEDWGFVASGNFNSVSQGTQFVGSLGTVKLPDLYGYEWQDPFSFSFFFDQFTDSRVDTFGSDLYLNGVRLQIGYALSESLEVGAIFSAPTHDDDNVKFLFVNFPNSLPTPGIIEMSESVSGYASGCMGDYQWGASAGYRDDPGTFTLSGNVRRPITESIALFSAASYEGNRGNWGVGFGVEFSFGGSARNTTCCCTTPCHAPLSPKTVIRAQNSDEADILLVNVPPQKEFPDPDSNTGEFPLMPEAPTISPFTNLNNRITNSWTNRYKNWSTRSLMILTPENVERGLNVDGLTNRMQDQLQSPFTKFSVQTNGGFGRTDGRRID